MCFGGGSPANNDLAIEQLRISEAEKARLRDQQKKDKKLSDFNTQLTGAADQSLNDASKFFIDQGLNIDDFLADISGEVDKRTSNVPSLSGSPSAYFDNLGQDVFNNLETSAQSAANRELDDFIGTNFARNSIKDTADDAFINSILNEEKANSNQYVQNLVDRGVITDTGFASAIADLDKQTFKARTSLNDIGDATLEQGRSDLRDIASFGRQDAANLNLGTTFDSDSYRGDINTSLGDFFSNLDTNLRSKIPTDLFNNKSLLSNAGRGQGAQNTRFDPRAFLSLDKEEEFAFDTRGVF